MGSIFFEITIIICLAAFLSIIFRMLKQPAIVAYILTGIIIGPFGQLQLYNHDALRTMAQLGITLLLFMLGLELKFKELKSIGKTALILGLGQIIITSIIGYLISFALGFPVIQALYITIALTFSSTIIVVKILSDKKDISSLYGKILAGILLIQDFFAIFILIILSAFNSNTQNALSIETFLLVFVKGIILVSVVVLISKIIFPKIIHIISKAPETLFLFSLAWVFGLAAIVSSKPIGFSIEIGGFLAGFALANSSENFQIIARVKALRDFFITIFFVVLGMEMTFVSAEKIIIPIIVFSAFVLFGKPLIVVLLAGVMGYRKRTSFLSGINVAQVSEFSLVIIFLGNKLGHIPSQIVSLIATIAIISFILSTYAITNSNNFYRLIRNYLGIFERKNNIEGSAKNNETDKKIDNLKDHVILIGAHRMGQSILDALENEGEKVVVVDFDPDIVEELKARGILSIFGDIADLDIQEKVQLHSAKLVISTVPDIDDNMILIKSLNHRKNSSNRRAKIVLMAQDEDDARDLYKKGADYVILPHLVGGRHLAKMIKDNDMENIDSLKSKDLKYLG
ncbi:MAG: cation:proton antiporter [Candidatus Levybacteria bacterium]|nr:cation:proton antiporter [Candidatus Levybacteria bacterium]